MPAPGSANALVLSTSSGGSDDEVPPGARAAALLAVFLDPTQYTAIAVVHELGRSAPRAFDLAKQRHEEKHGIAWVTDPELLADLTGDDEDQLRIAFAPERGKLMTFYAPRTGRTNWSLHWSKVTAASIDAGFLQAGLDQ